MNFDPFMQLVAKKKIDKIVSDVEFWSDRSSILTTDVNKKWFS